MPKSAYSEFIKELANFAIESVREKNNALPADHAIWKALSNYAEAVGNSAVSPGDLTALKKIAPARQAVESEGLDIPDLGEILDNIERYIRLELKRRLSSRAVDNSNKPPPMDHDRLERLKQIYGDIASFAILRNSLPDSHPINDALKGYACAIVQSALKPGDRKASGKVAATREAVKSAVTSAKINIPDLDKKLKGVEKNIRRRFSLAVIEWQQDNAPEL